MNSKSLPILIILTLLLAACGPLAPAPQPTVEPTTAAPPDEPAQPDEGTLDIESTPQPEDLPTPLPPETELIERPLDETAPWLFAAQNDTYGTPSGFLTANLDGTGQTEIPIPQFTLPDPENPTLPPQLVASALSPDGRFLALQTKESNLDIYLWVLQLPSGEPVLGTPMVGPTARLLVEQSPNIYVQSFPLSFLWSPDSSLLAVSAAIDGPSTDIYLFNTGTGLLTRQTSGDGQSQLLSWSPDSRYLVHLAHTNTEFGTRKIDGVYAFDAQTNALIFLYTPEVIGSETVAGWESNAVFYSYSAAYASITYAVRRVDINTAQVTPVIEALIGSASTGSGSPFIFVDLYGFPDYNPEVIPGLYSYIPAQGEFQKQVPPGYHYTTWVPELELYAAAERLTITDVLYFNTAGEWVFSVPRSHPTLRWPLPAPDGAHLLTPNGDHYELYDSQGELVSLVSGFGQVFWLPDSAGFIQIDAGVIYQYLAELGWQPQILNPAFEAAGTFTLLNPIAP